MTCCQKCGAFINHLSYSAPMMCATCQAGGTSAPAPTVLYATSPTVSANTPPQMSLRDWFAGQANEQDIAFWRGRLVNGEFPMTREQARYVYADAMLKAREQEGA